MAEAALAALAHGGARADGGANPGDSTWRLETEANGADIAIRCTGPDLPTTVPAETIHPTQVPKDRAWVGAYRLTVAAPLVALDVSWRPDAPMRIFYFSRGDWEEEVLGLAAG